MRRTTMAAVAALVMLAACGGGSDGPTEPESFWEEVIGNYALKTGNGQSLPILVSETASLRVELTGSVLAMRAGGSCSELVTFRETTAYGTRASTNVAVCSFTMTGRLLRITYTNGSQVTGQYENGTLTLATDNGVTLFYLR